MISALVYNRVTLTAQALELRIRLLRRVRDIPLPALLTELTPRVMPDPPTPLGEIWWALRRVEALYRRLRFVPDTCLYRALTRYALLRRSGHAAKFVMGMDPRAREDLMAHAWVELGGAPYQETLDARIVVTYVYPDGPV